QTGLGERLERDARIGILGEVRVEDGVRDLVAHFVGMAFGDRLRGEQEILKRHYSRLLLARRLSRWSVADRDSTDADGARDWGVQLSFIPRGQHSACRTAKKAENQQRA